MNLISTKAPLWSIFPIFFEPSFFEPSFFEKWNSLLNHYVSKDRKTSLKFPLSSDATALSIRPIVSVSFKIGVLLSGLLSPCFVALANDKTQWIEPLPGDSALPIMRGAGLPRIQSATLLNKDQSRFSINTFVHSNAIDSGSGIGSSSGTDSNSVTETLIIDGETRGVELTYRRGITRNVELGVATSCLNHSAGDLDSLIDDWHSTFGLSDGDRDLFEQDEFEFRYQQGEQVTRLNRSVSGISDTQVSLAYQFNRSSFHSIDNSIDSSTDNSTDNSTALSVRATVNLPTGDKDKATGSDKTDLSLGIATSGLLFNKMNLRWAGYLAYHYIGDDELFGIETKQHNWVASADIAWRASERWSWQAQFSGHSPLFESNINELEDAAWQFSVGTEYRFGRQARTNTRSKQKTIRVYFSEDISVNAAPDFAIGVDLRFEL